MKNILLPLIISVFFCSPLFSQVSSNTELSKKVIHYFQTGKMDSITFHFDEKMKEALSEEKLKAVWDDLIRQCGEYQKFSKITGEKQESYDIVYLLCHFRNVNLRMKVVYNKKNQISGLFFVP